MTRQDRIFEYLFDDKYTEDNAESLSHIVRTKTIPYADILDFHAKLDKYRDAITKIDDYLAVGTWVDANIGEDFTSKDIHELLLAAKSPYWFKTIGPTPLSPKVERVLELLEEAAQAAEISVGDGGFSRSIAKRLSERIIEVVYDIMEKTRLYDREEKSPTYNLEKALSFAEASERVMWEASQYSECSITEAAVIRKHLQSSIQEIKKPISKTRKARKRENKKKEPA